jgi:hypothetical protein
MILQAILVLAIVGVASLLSRVSSLSSNPHVRLWRGLAYGCISGILSAHSLLVAKSAVELLVRTIIDRVNQFNRWQSWAILLGLITLALVQLYYLHRGLKLVSTSVLYPLVFCIYNIIAILDGLIYFKQTDRLSLVHGLLIGLGTVILLAGVLALSWRLSDEQTQPAVTQSALAPGLGFVEDTDNEEYSDSFNADEEAAMRSEHQALLNGDPMTPTTKSNTLLGATRNIRKTIRLTEADEIWGELEDDTSKSPSPSRPPRRASHTLPPPAMEGFEADEHTSLLRSNTGRQRRRRSTGFPGFAARSSPRAPKRRSTYQPQQAVGGFWKMKWWGKTDGGGKGPPGPSLDEGDAGPSGSATL